MLTLFHDYTSPASAVAAARLQRVVDEGAAVTFAGFEPLGVDAPLPPPLDVLAAVEDLRDLAAAEGLRLHRPQRIPPTARAHVLGDLAERRGLGASWRQVCYRAFWEEAADLASAEVLTDLGSAAGLDVDEVAAALEDRNALAEIRRRTAAFRAEGVGGVPTLRAQRTLVPGLLDLTELRALAGLG